MACNGATSWCSTAVAAGLPVVVTMSGGYAHDVDAIVTIHANTIRCGVVDHDERLQHVRHRNAPEHRVISTQGTIRHQGTLGTFLCNASAS